MNQTAAIEVVEATSNDQELFIRFRTILKDAEQSKDFLATAAWDKSKNSEINLSKNLSVPLEIIGEEIWLNRPADLSSVATLSFEHWEKFRYQLAHSIAPLEERSGVVIRSDENELIFFYDETDQLKVLDIKEKPADVQILRVLTQDDLTEKVIVTLEQYLRELEIPSRKILFSSHDERDESNPFVYIDMDQGVVIHCKLPDDDRRKYRANLIKKGLKSADYLLIDSHVLGIVKRPVSSTVRLFSWTRETTWEVLKPPSLILLENKPPPKLTQGENMDQQEFEKTLNGLIGHEPSYGTMKFLIGGDAFFIRLIDALISAKESIDVRIFIFDNDDYAVKIADLLKRKSKEGVKIRVLLDGMGQVMGEGKTSETLPPDFVPPKSMEKYLRKDSKIKVRVRPSAWFKADHTKTIIIDEELFFTGGMNIGREYRFDWHDLMIEVGGSIVDEIKEEFEIAWAHAGPWGDLGYLKAILEKSTLSTEKQGYPIRTLYTRLNDPQIYKAQLAAIRSAKKYIYVHNAYLSDDTIIYGLIKARRRGVDVRVILPIHGNHKIMNSNNIVSANVMFKNGIRVFFYPGMSHIKAAVYDGWLCTGSANFDKLSFRDNLELNLATFDPQTVEYVLEVLFRADFEKSTEMKELLDLGIKERLAEFLAEQL